MQAAVQIARAGREPTVVEAAEAALVSKATAYRYFPTQEALLLDVSTEFFAHPGPGEVLRGIREEDVLQRWDAACRAVHGLCVDHEPLLRALERSIHDSWLRAHQEEDRAEGMLTRQGRRRGYIEEAIEPLRDELGEAAWQRLSRGLATLMGIGPVAALKDIYGAEDEEIAETLVWAGRAMIETARREAGSASTMSGPPGRSPVG